MNSVAVKPESTFPEKSDEVLRAGLLVPSANGWGYRPQLDGLRAVAVYLVVAFHAGLASFEGGFIGVDLFFVLSGFLVTNVILVDLSTEGRLRLVRFYSRRIRRLIPAAAVAVVGTSLAALLISSQLDRAAWSGDARASSLWFANWHFIGEANDYFLSDDATSPFQHFWSLSIEEQFYLGFPAILFGLWMLAKRRLTVVIGAVAALLVLGFFLQLYWAGEDQNRAYFATDARTYQLLVGVALALIVWRWKIPSFLERLAPLIAGAALLAFCFLATDRVDLSASMRGVLAAVFAGLLVVATQTATSGGLHRLLSWSPIQYLGQISYGTYLWHWPVVVLTLQLAEVSPKAMLVVSVGVGTAMAALSHELVERPIRQSERLHLVPKLVIACGVALAVLSGAVLAPMLLESDRRPVINSVGSQVVGNAEVQPVPEVDWVAASLAPPGAPTCEEPDGGDCIVSMGPNGTMLVIGDSHARMYLPAMQFVAASRGLELALAYSTSCPWMESAVPGGTPVGLERCREVRQLTYDSQIESLDPDIIVLAGYPYSIYPDGLDSTRPELSGLATPVLLERLVLDSIAMLEADNRQVVLIEPTPIFAEDPLACLSGATAAGDCRFPAQYSGEEERIYGEVASAIAGVVSIDVDPIACPRRPICDPVQYDYPVWRDENHLTTEFSRYLGPIIEDEMEQAGVFAVLE